MYLQYLGMGHPIVSNNASNVIFYYRLQSVHFPFLASIGYPRVEYFGIKGFQIHKTKVRESLSGPC